jgi:hypothetical protein
MFCPINLHKHTLYICFTVCVIISSLQHASGITFQAVPWLGLLVADLSPRMPGLAPGAVYAVFVLDKLVLGQVFLRVLRFSPVSIILPWLSILISYMWMNNMPVEGRSSQTQTHPIDMNMNDNHVSETTGREKQPQMETQTQLAKSKTYPGGRCMDGLSWFEEPRAVEMTSSNKSRKQIWKCSQYGIWAENQPPDWWREPLKQGEGGGNRGNGAHASKNPRQLENRSARKQDGNRNVATRHRVSFQAHNAELRHGTERSGTSEHREYNRFSGSSYISQKETGPCYPLGTIGIVPRAYEGMEGKNNKNKEMKSRKM